MSLSTLAYAVPSYETLCADGQDNDIDGLKDSGDPDCWCESLPIPQDRCYVFEDIKLSPGIYDLYLGIYVMADGVTLDCNGATIQGNRFYEDGIHLYGRNWITIKNCNIINYGNSIYIEPYSTFVTILNNNIQGAPDGIYVSSPSSFITILNNKMQGYPSTTNYGIYLPNSKSILISGNNISGYGSDIYGFGISSISISDNYIRGGLGYGIYLANTDSTIISKNTLSNSLNIFYSGSDGLITNNMVPNGYITLDSNLTKVSGNTIIHGSMEIRDDLNIIADNTFLESDEWGIFLWGANNNIIMNNIISGTKSIVYNGHGIIVYGSNSNRIIGNVISNSTNADLTYNASGIDLIYSSSNTISDNIICQNEADFTFMWDGNNSGSDNTCDKPDGWNDIDVVGCTYNCSPRPRVIGLEAIDDIDIRDVPNHIWPGRHSVADPMMDNFTIKATIESQVEPTVRYSWSISGSNKKDDGWLNLEEISGNWNGAFKVITPESVGRYTLNLEFWVYENGNKVNHQTMQHTLYVTYNDPNGILSGELNPPKEIWLEKATTWASGAISDTDVASRLNENIYTKSGWLYEDAFDRKGKSNPNFGDWQELVEGSKFQGNCWSFSNVWNTLLNVLGVRTPENSPTQTKGMHDMGFLTIPSTALDGKLGNAHKPNATVDKWMFGMHQIGLYDNIYYDPTFGKEYSSLNGFVDCDVISFEQDENKTWYGKCGTKKIYPVGPLKGTYTWFEYEYRNPSSRQSIPRASEIVNYTDYGLDTDNDGRYNHLVVEASVNISMVGNYSVFGILRINETVITLRACMQCVMWSGYIFSSEGGIENSEIIFSGEDIYQKGFSGNYNVILILIYDDHQTGYMIFNTSSYEYTSFGEKPLVPILKEFVVSSGGYASQESDFELLMTIMQQPFGLTTTYLYKLFLGWLPYFT